VTFPILSFLNCFIAQLWTPLQLDRWLTCLLFEMKINFLIFLQLFLFCGYFYNADAVLGVDMSSDICSSMQQSDWDCLVQSGYTFAIIQAFSGGYGQNPNIASCVSMAWAAGMNHVDMYMFMCPQCSGNSPPASAVQQLISTASSQGIQYGQIWFDVEQCSGCWNSDDDSNCEFVGEAVSAAQGAGASVGIYSSLYEWQSTVGDCANFSDLPLWYAHYDDDAGFDDEADYQFGGWTTPAMKQFNDAGPCVSVDVDYYPEGYLRTITSNPRTRT